MTIIPIKLNEAREIIKCLNKINMELADFSYIKSKISRLHVSLSMYAVTPREDSRFYRGVIYKEKPTSVDSLSYPPKNIVKNFKRCNHPENPMFYCSVDPSAALFELRVQPEDKVYLSNKKWTLPSGAKFTLTAEHDGWAAQDEDCNIVNPD